ncbi:hypothetical protein KO516_03310 [Citreicella sp. C3M06]|uniref:hypothetical protein n=1 Tax=Citreicella sp. C3M06 TaxID=2841564 RepID=UPI001C084C1F|nr:hypothetical protein [Citreicella sp. C3M06]MBU2959868.1 hypothetical protein [Citreicella sp. C3M06]
MRISFAIALCTLATPLFAQENGGEGPIYTPPGPVHTPQAHFPVTPVPPITIIPPLTSIASGEPRLTAQEANEASTQEIVDAISRSVGFCNSLRQDAYKVDCLAYAYWEVAQDLPRTGDYAAVRSTLEDAAAQIRRIAESNRAADLPRAKARRTGSAPKTTSRALTPVAPGRLPQARAAAEAVIREAQTTLIRSTGNSDRRRAQFEKISTAMESGTILLRAI